MSKLFIFDTECYRNYWLLLGYDTVSDKVYFVESRGKTFGHTIRDEVYGLLSDFKDRTWVGYNSTWYDNPMIGCALASKNLSQLKDINDEIIVGQKPYWEIYRRYGAEDIAKKVDHIDIKNVAPLTASLKQYGARIHCPTIQELPYDPARELNYGEMDLLREYCENDVKLTHMLYQALSRDVSLRKSLAHLCDEDLRSASDAQVGEKIMISQVMKRTGRRVLKPKSVESRKKDSIRFKPQEYMRYQDITFQKMAEKYIDTEYPLDANGRCILPEDFGDTKVTTLNDLDLQLGMGGVHSQEKQRYEEADKTHSIIELDVTSFYPAIIVNQRLCPENLGDVFVDAYEDLRDTRVKAKQEGDMRTADSLRIALNGTFGKFSNKWSKIYDPQVGMQITVTGQLTLLHLIETVELSGMEVISANTDGIFIRMQNKDEALLQRVVEKWHNTTGYQLEKTNYELIASRDVNNYIAVKTGLEGVPKCKGAYVTADENPLWKNPFFDVCNNAVIEHLRRGADIEKHILECADPAEFVAVRKVEGGAYQESTGEVLGSTVRYYRSTNEDDSLRYQSNGNLVAGSMGCYHMQKMHWFPPDDLHYGFYINRANEILEEIGART